MLLLLKLESSSCEFFVKKRKSLNLVSDLDCFDRKNKKQSCGRFYLGVVIIFSTNQSSYSIIDVLYLK